MTYRSGIFTGVLLTLLVIGGAGATYWLAGTKPAAAMKAEAPPPAKVAKTLKEDQINTIELRPEAMERLALTTGTVEIKPVRRMRMYGGEITVPAGQTVIVSAPLSGILKAPASGLPQPGRTVKKGQPLFELLPLLTPEGRTTLAATRVEAEGQLKRAETEREAARITLNRAKDVLKGGAGSKRAVDDAQAVYDVANEGAKAAKARCDLLDRVLGKAENGTAAPIPIECPEDGMLRDMKALPGQIVPSGAILFQVDRLQQVWVRVPVYVGDQPEIDPAAEAWIGNATGRGDESKQSAKPVVAPPSANATVGTVDFFYALDNRDAKYSPGQRVGATLTLRSEPQSLTVPWAAVIHDLYGGTWVYVQTKEREFVRQRVIVRYVSGDTTVLAAGPTPGTKVVTAGAAELFGSETGFTK